MWPLQNKLQTSWLTHDTMRMMVCGCWKKVMGSKAPPAFPAPYACIPSMVQILLGPSCPSLLQRLWLRGAPGRRISPKLLPLLWLPQHGWMDGRRWMDGRITAQNLSIKPSCFLKKNRVWPVNKFLRCPGSILAQELWANKPVLWCCFLRLQRTSRWRTRERGHTVTPLVERPRRSRARTRTLSVRSCASPIAGTGKFYPSGKKAQFSLTSNVS